MNFVKQSPDFWIKVANVLVLAAFSIFFKRVLYPQYSQYAAFQIICAFCTVYCILSMIVRYRALSRTSL